MASTIDTIGVETTTELSGGDTDIEISNLKEKFGTDCRVIENVGEFVHVISISFKEWDIKVKFQLTEHYPLIPAELVVVSGSSTSEPLSADLYQFLQSCNPTLSSVTEYAELVRCWLADKDTATVTINCDKPRKNKKKTKTSRTTNVDADKNGGGKKPAMKTAEDVINRIHWDSQISQDEFAVGYVDRFLGLMEQNFTTFSWEDIASVDDFTALAIPKHRIQYFKYRGVVVWDKTLRLDNVFGSTGGGLTISDVKEQSESEGSAGRSGQSEEPNESRGKTVVEAIKNDAIGSVDEDDDTCDSDSDSDSNIEVNIHDCQPGGHTSVSAEQLDGQVRKRPNYFICVRITNPTIIAGVQNVQSEISKIDPRFIKCYASHVTLHLTLCTLGLDTDYQLRNACQALNECRPLLSEIARRRITFHVAGVDHFYARVVYAKVRSNANLDELVCRIRGALTDAGVDIREGYDFVPHVTVLKLSKSLDGSVGVNRLPPFTYRNFHDTDFGEQEVSSINLCAMTNERSDSGFYVTPLHLELLDDSDQQTV